MVFSNTPGEPEIRRRKQRVAEGIPLPDDPWAVAAAREVGVDEICHGPRTERSSRA
jgi:hypothetical protein